MKTAVVKKKIRRRMLAVLVIIRVCVVASLVYQFVPFDIQSYLHASAPLSATTVTRRPTPQTTDIRSSDVHYIRVIPIAYPSYIASLHTIIDLCKDSISFTTLN